MNVYFRASLAPRRRSSYTSQASLAKVVLRRPTGYFNTSLAPKFCLSYISRTLAPITCGAPMNYLTPFSYAKALLL